MISTGGLLKHSRLVGPYLELEVGTLQKKHKISHLSWERKTHLTKLPLDGSMLVHGRVVVDDCLLPQVSRKRVIAICYISPRAEGLPGTGFRKPNLFMIRVIQSLKNIIPNGG